MSTTEGLSMRESLVFSGVCLLISLIGFGIAAWAIVSGQIWVQGVDGLFLIIIGLLVALTFAINPLKEFKRLMKNDKSDTPKSK